VSDKVKLCGTSKAPKGWECIREKGHEGPCAAIPKQGRWSRFVDGLGEAIGEALFGGNR
jgi:hypothetical protein